MAHQIFETPDFSTSRVREGTAARRRRLGEPDVSGLATSHGFGLAQDHAFVDGNTRAAFRAIGLLLGLNGKRPATAQLDATETILRLAAGDIDEAAFAEWIRQHLADR